MSRNPETSNNNSKERDTPRRAGLGTTLRVLGVIAGGATIATGAAACAPSDVKAEPGYSAPATPSESTQPTQTPEAEKPTTTIIEIPVGLEAQEVGELIVGELTSNWKNAGANDALLDRSIDENMSWEELLPIVADENAQEYADGILIEGYENDPNLVKFVDTMRTVNLSTLDWYRATAWNEDQEPKNVEGYRLWNEVLGVEELQDEDPNARSLEITYVERSNSDKNVGPEANPTEIILSVTLVPDADGKTEDIAAASIRSNQ